MYYMFRTYQIVIFMQSIKFNQCAWFTSHLLKKFRDILWILRKND